MAVRKGVAEGVRLSGAVHGCRPRHHHRLQPGYRSSWDAALGKVGSEVFQDNLKAWSGDHCVDPSAGARRDLLQSQARARQSRH